MKFSDGFWLMRAGVGAVTGGTATAHPHGSLITASGSGLEIRLIAQ